VKRSNFYLLNDLDRAIQDNYDAKIYHGRPVGLQIVGEEIGRRKGIGDGQGCECRFAQGMKDLHTLLFEPELGSLAS
jgi:hypothetical protein